MFEAEMPRKTLWLYKSWYKLCVLYDQCDNTLTWCCPLLQSKIGLHKTPQAAQALASHADVKGMGQSHSSSIPPELIPLRTSAWEATQALAIQVISEKKISSTEKNISLVACNAAEKYVTRYMPEKYILPLLAGSKSPIKLSSKVNWSTPNH